MPYPMLIIWLCLLNVVNVSTIHCVILWSSLHIRFVVVGIMGLRLGCSIFRGELCKETASYCNDCDDDVVHVDKKKGRVSISHHPPSSPLIPNSLNGICIEKNTSGKLNLYNSH